MSITSSRSSDHALRRAPAGELRSLARQVTSAALASGALLPIRTSSAVVHDSGVGFIVRVVENLARKDAARRAAVGDGPRLAVKPNPFLPYDEALFVCDLSETHLCLLNKFNVLDDHLLIVTRSFEEQERLLTLADFEALWLILGEIDGVAFYNGGEMAGASQRHKHLQLVPLPLVPEVEGIPIEPLLSEATFEGGLGRAPGLPFVHGLARLDLVTSPAEAARRLLRAYLDLMSALVLADAELTWQRAPHNVVITRQWMLAVPRSAEFYEKISVNSLGFIGGLLVRTREQLEAIRRIGPMTVLRHVGVVRGD
jgi:ATP adenylyltransferase